MFLLHLPTDCLEIILNLLRNDIQSRLVCEEFKALWGCIVPYRLERRLATSRALTGCVVEGCHEECLGRIAWSDRLQVKTRYVPYCVEHYYDNCNMASYSILLTSAGSSLTILMVNSFG